MKNQHILGKLTAWAVGAFALAASAVQGAAFTPGNLVVLQIGDGTTSVSGASASVFLKEFTTAGAPVQSITIPDTTAGNRLTVTGSSTSSGHLSLSANGQYIVFGGFDLPPATASASGTLSTATGRVIARVDMSGNVDLSTSLGSASGFSGGDNRSVVSVDGTAFWAAGNGTGGGIRYAPFANPFATASTLVSATPTNDRVAVIFNNQLYMTSASGSNIGVNTVGTGVPNTTGQTATLIAASTDAYGFAFSSPTRMFVADNTAGLKQFDLSGTWSLTNTFATAGGLRGLALGTVGGNATLFVTDSVASPNHVLSTSVASPGTFATLATAPANTVLRGVVQIPTGSSVEKWNQY